MTGDDDLRTGIPSEVLDRAEAALAAMADDFLARANSDLARLRDALSPFRADRLAAIAHDIKGQAGTFGFPRVGELALRLCRLLEAHPGDAAGAARLVDALGDAVASGSNGDGDGARRPD